MATRKQLAALAKARAARKLRPRPGIRCRTTRKRTGAEIETDNKFKTAVVNASKSIWSALKKFSTYLGTTGIALAKNTSMAALNTLRKQSTRLTYIKILLEELSKAIDNIGENPDKAKIEKLDKNVTILIKLVELEKEENNELPKRFLREIEATESYINKLKKAI